MRKGAATVGALALGGAAFAGEAAATDNGQQVKNKTGGVALFKKYSFQRKRPWKVIKKVNRKDLPASCNASQSADKTYNFYKIQYKRMKKPTSKGKKRRKKYGYIATRKKLYPYRKSGQWFRFNSQKQDCNDPVYCKYNYKAAFGPAKVNSQ